MPEPSSSAEVEQEVVVAGKSTQKPTPVLAAENLPTGCQAANTMLETGSYLRVGYVPITYILKIAIVCFNHEIIVFR